MIVDVGRFPCINVKTWLQQLTDNSGYTLKWYTCRMSAEYSWIFEIHAEHAKVGRHRRVCGPREKNKDQIAEIRGTIPSFRSARVSSFLPNSGRFSHCGSINECNSVFLLVRPTPARISSYSISLPCRKEIPTAIVAASFS